MGCVMTWVIETGKGLLVGPFASAANAADYLLANGDYMVGPLTIRAVAHPVDDHLPKTKD